ncbi:tetratricopeptide repeat-containing sulfotransferase family protein [Prochlorococcus sp. MIT 0916]|uniref:tetratricopeptide repeat-containing sulfotransferase family protein n=1 Tax=Prochlorococcus sp. MIT 0916 TaxID=3082521 RepID=UPI0039B36900
MKNQGKKPRINKNKNNFQTYIVPPIKNEKVIIKSNLFNNLSREEIISIASNFDQNGNIIEATKYYQHFIDRGFSDPKVFCNYGIILRNKGNLKGSIKLHREAIKIKPDLVEAHYNLGNTLKELGEIKQAEISLRKAIKFKPLLAEAHNNLCNILKDQGKLKEAEEFIIKALEIKPNNAIALYNYGAVLKDLGKLKKSEIYLCKAIKLNPNLVAAYYILSTVNPLNTNKDWQQKIFDDEILNKKTPSEKTDIFFARANILHAKKNYNESSKCLIKANNIKYTSQASNYKLLIQKSKLLLLESNEKQIYQNRQSNNPKSIFIVGMPRSGSTLIESILSMNRNVDDLGETTILEESFLEWKKQIKINQKINLAKIYWRKASYQRNKYTIKTNKNLYNYLYTGIILNHIPNVKIVHCFRNPLDNILSIYRAHFAKDHIYCSSLTECAKIYLNTENIINEYKKRYSSKIYEVNYDLLVSNPQNEIRNLISWMGWEWDNSYLSPHLNNRVVLTASNVQVRSPINSKSFGGWKKYREMLKPAIEIISKNPKYIDLIN